MDAKPESQPRRPRRHLLRRPEWFLSTGAAVLVLVLIVGAVTWFNGGFALQPPPGQQAQ
jgi:hypothetical protein